MKKRLISLLIISALLTGYQYFISKTTKQDIQHSYAWNVNHASNMDVFYDKNVSPEVKIFFLITATTGDLHSTITLKIYQK